MTDAYQIIDRIPDVADFCRLRAIAGMTPRSVGAAAKGLPSSIFGVVVEHCGTAVGMGRVIGDGGLVFNIADIAVDPAHQRRGLGKAIMQRLLERLRASVTAEAYVTLIADGPAQHLYVQYGFVPVAPASIGMAMWL
ncbi:MAG: GNAT family N-acetyltransferase [Polymorphobacter sp.]